MKKKKGGLRKMVFPAIIIASSIFIFIASLYSFLLFHALVEIITAVIAFGIFVVAWSSRRYIDNIFLFIFGVGYFFVGALDLLHTFAYGGIDIITGYGANLSTQLWISARYLEAASLVGAFLFLTGDVKKITSFVIKRSYGVLFAYAGIFFVILLSIFYFDVFPDAYIAGVGMTPFKVHSEYVIVFLLTISFILLFKKRKSFDEEMVNLLSLSIIMKIFSGLFFTQYVEVHNFSNSIGHIFRFISFLLLYKAFFEVGLDKPYKFMFLNLKKSEERYRSLVEFSPDPIIVHRKGRIIYANELARKFFSIDDENINKVGVIDLFHPKHEKEIKRRVKKVFSGEWKETPLTEMEVLRADGESTPVEVKAIKITYEGKEAIESIIRDISDRRKAEEKIRSMAQFPEEDPNPVIRALKGGIVQYANKPARKMLKSFGWKEELPLPEPLLSAVKTVLEKNEKPDLEISCKCNRIYNMGFSHSFTDGHVNIYGRDVTDRRLAEKKLAETQVELQKRIEGQLTESYEHVGKVNRKISLLLELGESFQDKKSKQELVDYILKSALGISGAKIGMIYVAVGKNHFNLISSSGLSSEKLGKLQMVAGGEFDFISKMIEEKKRVSGPVKFDESGSFNGDLEIKYFTSLPFLTRDVCSGFLFLGFENRESMDAHELEFLDVFSQHTSSAIADSSILN